MHPISQLIRLSKYSLSLAILMSYRIKQKFIESEPMHRLALRSRKPSTLKCRDLLIRDQRDEARPQPRWYTGFG